MPSTWFSVGVRILRACGSTSAEASSSGARSHVSRYTTTPKPRVKVSPMKAARTMLGCTPR
jgi:hypothetical protein